jgi:hypothetical protein
VWLSICQWKLVLLLEPPYTLKQGNTAIAGIVSYSGTTAVFTPTVALAANTVYTATVSAAVTNLDNTRLPSEYVWKLRLEL